MFSQGFSSFASDLFLTTFQGCLYRKQLYNIDCGPIWSRRLCFLNRKNKVISPSMQRLCRFSSSHFLRLGVSKLEFLHCVYNIWLGVAIHHPPGTWGHRGKDETYAGSCAVNNKTLCHLRLSVKVWQETNRLQKRGKTDREYQRRAGAEDGQWRAECLFCKAILM